MSFMTVHEHKSLEAHMLQQNRVAQIPYKETVKQIIILQKQPNKKKMDSALTMEVTFFQVRFTA